MNSFKKYLIPSAIAVLTATALAVSSCSRVYSWRYGEDVIFSANTESHSATKVAYGERESNTNVPVLWTEGEIIRIFCDEASEPDNHFADYIVNGNESSASISLAEAIGLRWGPVSKTHTFYGGYPSPRTIEEYNSLGKGYYSARVPEKQMSVSISGDGDLVAAPDMQTLAMVSKTVIPAGKLDFGSVSMQFVPIVTAIEFKIQNGYSTDDDLDIKEIQIISENHGLSGQYTSNLLDWNNQYPNCSALDGTTNNIAGVDFSRNPVYLQKGKTLTFTVFFLPCSDLDDLTFKIIHTDDSWLSTKLAYADKTGILFNRCKKSYVSGILVPESAKWNVNYSDDLVVSPWESSERTIIPQN